GHPAPAPDPEAEVGLGFVREIDPLLAAHDPWRVTGGHVENRPPRAEVVVVARAAPFARIYAVAVAHRGDRRQRVEQRDTAVRVGVVHALPAFADVGRRPGVAVERRALEEGPARDDARDHGYGE